MFDVLADAVARPACLTFGSYHFHVSVIFFAFALLVVVRNGVDSGALVLVVVESLGDEVGEELVERFKDAHRAALTSGPPSHCELCVIYTYEVNPYNATRFDDAKARRMRVAKYGESVPNETPHLLVPLPSS